MASAASGLDRTSEKLCSLLAPEDEDAFEQLLAIYQAAIVASEQKPPAELRGMLRSPGYRILVAREGQRVVGFAILYFPSGGTFWLLEYMAVEQSLRSKRYGERIFSEAKLLGGSVMPGAPCVLEVDQPGEASPADDASRRLGFYRRLGCRRVEGLGYLLPLKSAGSPPPMMLLVHGLEDRDFLAAAEMTEWLRAIYVEVYAQGPDDPRITAMMAKANELKAMRLLRSF